jgi:hypothetical protein
MIIYQYHLKITHGWIYNWQERSGYGGSKNAVTLQIASKYLLYVRGSSVKVDEWEIFLS